MPSDPTPTGLNERALEAAAKALPVIPHPYRTATETAKAVVTAYLAALPELGDRNHWIRAFNRLETAVRRHIEAKERAAFGDEADAALQAAHMAVMRDVGPSQRLSTSEARDKYEQFRRENEEGHRRVEESIQAIGSTPPLDEWLKGSQVRDLFYALLGEDVGEQVRSALLQALAEHRSKA